MFLTIPNPKPIPFVLVVNLGSKILSFIESGTYENSNRALLQIPQLKL